jgi:hypothetical protein
MYESRLLGTNLDYNIVIYFIFNYKKNKILGIGSGMPKPLPDTWKLCVVPYIKLKEEP